MSSLFAPTTTGALTIPPGFQCVSGTVFLFRFLQPPQGGIIGTITTPSGGQLSLIQTQPTPLGGTPLSSVDGQFATLCGPLVHFGGQVVLDVRIINPGAPSPTGTPQPLDLQTLLLLLLILLLFSVRGLNVRGLSSLLGQPGTASLLNQPLVQNLLSQPGAVQSLLNQVQAAGIDVNELIRSLR